MGVPLAKMSLKPFAQREGYVGDAYVQTIP